MVNRALEKAPSLSALDGIPGQAPLVLAKGFCISQKWKPDDFVI